MGSTVTTGKRVGALMLPSGRIGYLLCEQTYEKNVYPHNPSWSCIGMGYLEDVLKTVFSRASACEGGELQTRSGATTPESYIKGWLTELGSPLEIGFTGAETLKFSQSWSATLPLEKRDEIIEALKAAGMEDRMHDLDSPKGYEVTLRKDFDLLRVIFNGVLGTWRYIRQLGDYGQPRNLELGYSPVSVKPPIQLVPAMYRTGLSEHVLVCQEDGTFRSEGWSYSVVGKFVRDYAARELQHPGSYRKSIQDFREAVASAPVAPADTKMVISQRDGAWPGRLESIAKALGKKGQEPIETTLQEVIEKKDGSLNYQVGDYDGVQWHIKEQISKSQDEVLALA